MEIFPVISIALFNDQFWEWTHEKEEVWTFDPFHSMKGIYYYPLIIVNALKKHI
jgi:hypothetical protein